MPKYASFWWQNRRILVASGTQLKTLTTRVPGQGVGVAPEGRKEPENGVFADIWKVIELMKKKLLNKNYRKFFFLRKMKTGKFWFSQPFPGKSEKLPNFPVFNFQNGIYSKSAFFQKMFQINVFENYVLYKTCEDKKFGLKKIEYLKIELSFKKMIQTKVVGKNVSLNDCTQSYTRQASVWPLEGQKTGFSKISRNLFIV